MGYRFRYYSLFLVVTLKSNISGKSNILSVSAPCLILLDSKASYSLNLYGKNTGHQRSYTHADMVIGQSILKSQYTCSEKMADVTDGDSP